jgi:hypothetical protein
MGMKVELDVDSIIATMEAIGKDATKAGVQALFEGGKEIQELAREYAPVDDGHLEQSIITMKVPSEYTVHVGIDPRALDEHGRPVNDYGMMMHEFQTIGGGSVPGGMGIYGLGPKSQAKDGGRGVVGGKFLERAFNELKRKVLQKTGITVKRIFT